MGASSRRRPVKPAGFPSHKTTGTVQATRMDAKSRRTTMAKADFGLLKTTLGQAQLSKVVDTKECSLLSSVPSSATLCYQIWAKDVELPPVLSQNQVY